MLSVRELRKSFRSIPALDGVSFDAPRGHVTGYLGANGSGKSTTFKIITGLLDADGGHVAWDGNEVRGDSEEFKKILGYVPEEPHLYSHLSGLEYLELAGQLRMVPAPVLWPRIEKFLMLLSLWEDRYSLLSSYSKGMKQKILLASALLDDPQLVILDEPMNGLDIHSVLVLRRVITGLAAAGKAVVLSSHELETVEKVCTRVVILHRGKVMANDEVAGLREMMQLKSLEAIFTQLAVREDPEAEAEELLKAARS